MPGSVWEHNIWQEATNITVFHKPEPVELESCILFPCPLHEKYSTKNPTAWINAKETSKPCIGLAHGNVEGIPNGEPDYPIPRDAASRQGLDYLALGHWHSFARYDDADGVCRMAYCGTHETTKFGERDSGNAVVVEIEQHRSPSKLTPVKTGRFDWRIIERTVDQPHSLEAIIEELGKIDQPASVLLRVILEGVLFPEDRKALVCMEELLASRFLFGFLESSRLIPAPDGEGWIESLSSGAFREAAIKLRSQAAQSANPEERAVATQALLQLFELHERSRV
jgi:hypothetical protein